MPDPDRAFVELMTGGGAEPGPAADFEGVALERRSIAEQVASRILALVKSGNLKSGDRLPTEQQMAVALGISRPALREALKALTVLGVLESRQGGRYTVTDLSPSRLVAPLQFLMFVKSYDVGAHFEARAAVDLDLVRLAAARATDAERRRRARLAEDGRAFVSDPVGFRVLDFEFHQTINEAARSPLLATVAQGLYDIALAVRRIAVFGARSRSAVISRRARPAARLSRNWPPAYISATAAPAKGSPRRRALAMATRATMSSPTSARARLRAISTARAAMTGSVATVKIARARSLAPEK